MAQLWNINTQKRIVVKKKLENSKYLRIHLLWYVPTMKHKSTKKNCSKKIKKWSCQHVFVSVCCYVSHLFYTNKQLWNQTQIMYTNTPKYGNNPIRKTQERKKKEKQPCKNPTKPTQHKCSSCNNKKSTPNTHTHTHTHSRICVCMYVHT